VKLGAGVAGKWQEEEQWEGAHTPMTMKVGAMIRR